MNRQFVFRNEPFEFYSGLGNKFDQEELNWEYNTPALGNWEFFDEYEATPCKQFTPMPVESPGGQRIKDKRIPASSEIVVIDGAFAKTPLHRLAAEALKALVCAARVDGIRHPRLLPTGSLSGFRTPKQQASLRSSSAATHGSQDIGKWVAKPGSSAHQTGRAIDFYLGMRNSRENVARLRQTQAYKWMVANAHRFGFYPYPAEPWHWEYNPPSAESEFENRIREMEMESLPSSRSTFRLECPAGCAPFPADQCQTILRRAILDAISLANNAASKLTASTRESETIRLFRFFFGHDPSRPVPWAKNQQSGVIVAQRFLKCARELGGGRRTLYRCGCPGSGPGVRAITINPTEVTLCPRFWGASPQPGLSARFFRAGVILHEMLHQLYLEFVLHNPKERRRNNAHCLEAFAMRLAGHAADQSDVRQCRNRPV